MAESDPSLCFLTSASCFLSSRRQYKSRRVSEKRNSSLPGQSSSLATDSGDGSPHVAKRKTCRARLAPGLANQRIELLPRGRGDPLEHKRVVLGDHHKLNSGFKPELGTDGLGNHDLSSRGHLGGQRGHSLTSKTPRIFQDSARRIMLARSALECGSLLPLLRFERARTVAVALTFRPARWESKKMPT